MLHTKNFGLLEFALQLEPTAVGLRAAAGARAQSSFLSETRGSQISPPIRTEIAAGLMLRYNKRVVGSKNRAWSLRPEKVDLAVP